MKPSNDACASGVHLGGEERGDDTAAARIGGVEMDVDVARGQRGDLVDELAMRG